MKCAECIWGIWDYTGNGIHKCCVDCKAGLDDKCPTEMDFEAAKYGGYLAYYGCAERINDKEETKMKRSEFMKNVEEVDFADAVCGLMLKGYDVGSEDALVDYAKTLLDNGEYADADTIIEALMETSYGGYYRTDFCGGTPYPINDIEDIEDLLEED